MFAFIESFFLLSLGITFIMIFLMVFHFKQRIEKLERKNNDLSDLTNTIIKEVKNLHILQSSFNNFQPQQQQQNLKQPKEHICENIRISTSIPIPVYFAEEEGKKKEEEEPTYKKIIVMDNIINDDIIIADEFSDEDNDDDDSNSSSSSFNYDDSDMEIENFDKEEIHYIKFEEIEQLQKKEEPEPEPEPEPEQIQLNYNKMTVSNLKILAISKGLCSDTSKIKRADLVKLLEENET